MSDLPSPDWYPDPEQPGQLRYWDGTQWTDHRAPAQGSPQPGAWSPPAQEAAPPGGGWPSTPGPSGGAGTQPTTDGVAIAAIVLGLLSFFGAFIVIGALGGVIALVLGIVALRRIRGSGGQRTGRGLAISGIVLGSLSVVVGVLVFAAFAALFQSSDFRDLFDCMMEAAEAGREIDPFVDC